jgi:2-isopropylmalate synthase
MADSAASLYDWNEKERHGPLLREPPRFVDETLRHGLQSPAVKQPSLEQKLELVRMMDRLGIDAVNLGRPGAGPRAAEDVERLARMIAEEHLHIQATCAARAIEADIRPIVEISQKLGVSIEVGALLESSPVRSYAEDWDAGRLEQGTRDAIRFIVGSSLPAALVTEDTTRAHPRLLDRLFRAAIEAGATRLVLSDTCGHATPDGLRSLVGFTRSVLRGLDVEDRVELDWHGHNDRGLALVLGLFALEHGIDRVHGCGLGLGERVGSTPIDLLLLNLFLLGQVDGDRHDLSVLVQYVRKISEYTGVAIPPSYPLSGRDAFRTAEAAHAEAVSKAEARGDIEQADRVFSSVPAHAFGRVHEIEVGPDSGPGNAAHWLRRHGIEVTEAAVARLLDAAKQANRTLDEAEAAAALAGP